MTESPLAGTRDAGSGDPIDTAICCSGGGIRSATYCLGAMQALAADGRLRSVDLVTAVSGGSYIAAAWALQADFSVSEKTPTAGYRAEYQNAFRPGSPEESRLRDHTHYLIPNAAQGLRGIMSLIWGALGNLVLVASISYVVLGLDGRLLRAIGGVHWTSSGSGLTPALTIMPLQVWVPAGLGIAGVLTFAASRTPLGRRNLSRADGTLCDRLMFWTTALLGLAVAATLLLVAGPALFAAALNVHWIATGMSGQPSAGSVAATLSLYALGLATLAKAAAGNVSAYWSRLGKGGQGMLRPWLARVGRVLLPWLGSALIVAGLIAWGVYVLGISTHPAYQPWHLAIAAGIFLVLHVALDVNRTSLHDFYRDRLVNGYADRSMSATRLSQLHDAAPALTVCAAANLSSGTIRSSRPAAAPRGAGRVPARAGRRASPLQRGVPPGRGAVSWVFTPDATGLHYPNVGGGQELAPTAAYELLMGADRMTLFDLVADSGAAISPLMGRATSAAHRLLLAAVNVRLGVWLPRPALVKLVHERVEQDAHLGQAEARAGLAEWAGALAGQGLPGSLSRWWLSCQLASWERVYRIHRAAVAGANLSLAAQIVTALRWRIWQPNLMLLWREAAGRNPVGQKWIYVTDGGHYDNLGLVEALRRHPRRIYLLDASGDPEHSYRTLGQAIALARSDLGVEISIDPGQMEFGASLARSPVGGRANGDGQGQGGGTGGSADGGQAGGPGGSAAGDGAGGASGGASGGAAATSGFLPGSRPAQVRQPFATGTFRYTSGPRAGQQGTLSMIKLGVWAGADLPWDVRSYYEAHPTFPRASTLQQLYDDEDFEAYRELGVASMRALLASSRRHPQRHHRPRHDQIPTGPGAPTVPEPAPAV
ncbi:MAG TPA: patatin-like phospholipase family protein [Streptosporangiaceae bacterium]